MGKRQKIQRVAPQEFTTIIEDVAFLGEGLAHLGDDPVYIANAIPGERVVAEITRKGRRFLEADLKEVLEPSPHRVKPPCQYFGACTGCQWQHMDYPYQLELKHRLVVDHLERVGQFRDPPVPPTIGCENPWAYRNHARFTVRQGQLGFVNRATRRFVRIDECMLMDNGVNNLLAELQEKCSETSQLSIRYGPGTGDWLIQPTLKSTEIGMATGQEFYKDEVMGRPFRVSSPSFFQVNGRQAERLIDLLWARLNLSGVETVVDAYAGVGTFASVLASRAKLVIAIEESSAAVKDARENLADLPNVELVLARTETALAEMTARPDRVILDPPRTGCHEDALRALIRLLPPRVVYVSCDPASLARDLRILCQDAYELLEVQPIDMFPHTHHVEAVATLQKRTGQMPTVIPATSD